MALRAPANRARNYPTPSSVTRASRAFARVSEHLWLVYASCLQI